MCFILFAAPAYFFYDLSFFRVFCFFIQFLSDRPRVPGFDFSLDSVLQKCKAAYFFLAGPLFCVMLPVPWGRQVFCAMLLVRYHFVAFLDPFFRVMLLVRAFISSFLSRAFHESLSPRGGQKRRM